MSVRIIRGDMLAILPTLAADSIHAVITDPPYHLTSIVKRFGSATAAPCKVGQTGAYARASRGFMGQTWDGGDIAMRPETWAEVYRVMKPGAHLVAFGGTRTYHRMACAIEDAGFEIRDTLAWIYGSGFPKSHDVAKGIDKAVGAEREKVAPRSVIGHQRNIGNRRPYTDDPDHKTDSDIPATAAAAEWQGWGSALKPAFEPIILARKPLDGTIAGNTLKHGCGGINIDASRIDLADDDKLQDGIAGRDGAALDTADRDGAWGFKAVDRAAGLGRFPANVLHDGSDEVLGAFAAFGEKSSNSGNLTHKSGAQKTTFGKYGACETQGITDSGTAARFFYCAKADSADRAGSKHPTVKPLALMSWLVKLIAPVGGTILDPFAGSGTTLLAADRLRFNVIGVEKSAEYIADIHRRLTTDAGLFTEIEAT